MRQLRHLTVATVLSVTTAMASAGHGFVIKQIQFQGLSRITAKTARHYLPVHVGQTLTADSSTDIIQTLYNTNFFSNVQVSRQGSALIIKVQERPTIGLIRFSGNKKIKNKQLLGALKQSGISDGMQFDRADLSNIVSGLKQEYQSLGYDDVVVTANVEQEPRNRVAIDIQIHEGETTKVNSITIDGAHAFSASTVKGQMTLTTSSMFSWFTSNDEYTEDKLNKDLASITNFYLDRGYLHFQVLSHKASLTKAGKVNIVISVNEGAQYHISGFGVKDNMAGDSKRIASLIDLKKGELFSRARIMALVHTVGENLADRGYAFPDVNVAPKVDDVNHTVMLTFVVNPGRRVYVRRINIFGNGHTMNEVMRREMRQLEGSLFNADQIQESKRRLANLAFLKNIVVQPQKIPGQPNQVDLNYHAEEVEAGRASLMGGYSDVDGFLYGGSISEPNFMGTGKSVGLSLTRSAAADNYQFNYYNPYYTINGMGRGYSIYYQHSTPSGSTNQASYVMNGFGGNIHYNVPITEYSNITFGAGFDRRDIIPNASTAPEITSFIDRYGSRFNQFTVNTGWDYSNYDRFIFPTKGFGNSIGLQVGVPIVSDSLKYYRAAYHASWYEPLTLSHNWVVNIHTDLGYGNGYGGMDELPFFANFFAGGIDTLPGFEPNTVGPKDQFYNGLGGNVEAVAGAELIFPNHISQSLRTGLTFNAGNIYNTSRDAVSGSSSLDGSGPVRYSVGLEVAWYSPFGPLRFSLAQVLNKQTNDQTSLFNFSFGANI